MESLGVNTDFLSVLGGLIVGLVLGLVGGGGSILAVPLMIYGVGIPSVHVAIGTSAVAVSLNALANLIIVIRRGLVKWRCALVFAGSGMLGSLAGSHLALMMDGKKLLFLFGGLMLGVGSLMLAKKNAEGDASVRLTRSTARYMLPRLVSTGLAVGLLAGFFGIGGGFLIVPGLMFATGMPIAYAIGSSLVGVTAFGITGASAYAFAGLVDIRIVLFFLGGGVLGSAIGQTIGSRILPYKSVTQTIFAGLVVFVGMFIVFQSFNART